MLFVLDSSMAEALDKAEPDPAVISAIEDMASSYRKGNHLLSSDRNTLKRIIASTHHLSRNTRIQYRSIFDNLPETDAYNLFTRRINLVAERGIRRVEEVGNKRIIHLSAEYVKNIIAPTNFLTEDLSEQPFYKKIAGAYIAANNRLGRISLCCQPLHGGGDRTGQQYRVVQEAGDRLCLCIIDSDRKYGGGKFGETAKKVQQIESETPQPFCELLILEVRMVENLIPLSLLQLSFQSNQQKTKVITTLAQIEPEQRKYLHLRDGFKVREYLDSTGSFRAFWQATADGRTTCRESEPCEFKGKCKCFIIEPLGKILEDVVKGNNFAVEDSLRSEWERIGSLIVAWCCGSLGIRG